MAGEWIKVELTTPDKPEVLRMSRILGIDKDAVFGKLIRLWAWFDRNSVDGVVDGVVDSDVDALCYQTGFSAALVSVGWISFDSDAERVSLPKFDRHNGESAKKRALKNEAQARWRANKDANVDTQQSTSESTTASTREEKRREEGKTNSADKKPSSISLQSFLDSLNGARAIDSDDPIFAYCEKCGISEEMLNLCWLKFKDYYLENPSKKYKDWRKTFRNCVKDNWYGIWWFNADNKAELSNKGRQAAVSFKEAA